MKKTLSILLVISILLSVVGCASPSKEESQHTHSFGEWETVKKATCMEDGKMVHYCKCGETETQAIPAKGHSFVNGKCSVCGLIEEGLFSKQYWNSHYYFSQGFPDDWEYSVGEEDYAIRNLKTKENNEGFYCFNFFPSGENMNKVNYSIYKYNTQSMMQTLDSISKNFINPDSSYYFNDVFLQEEDKPRESFRFTTEPESDNPNHFQFHYMNYEFTKEGENWKGTVYIAPCDITYFVVICMEAQESVWDQYNPIFKEMIRDFGFLGYDASENKWIK